RIRLSAALLAACRAMAAIDHDRHPGAVAGAQGRADRVAVSSSRGGRASAGPVEMTDKASAGPSRGWFWPTLLTLCALAILIGLGVWQMERKTWKENLIATVTARLAAPPMAGVPPRDQWDALERAQMEYRRVSVPVEFLNDQEALVYTIG